MGDLPFVRSIVRNMEGYTPGEQPRPGQRVIKLNTNENPFPPSPRVMEAIRNVGGDALRRYPDPNADAFRAAAARLHGVTPDMIVTGNGSDDVLAFAILTFLGPGDLLAYPDPTYSLYPVLAALEEVKCAAVPWGKNWSLPIEDLAATRARAIFLANPNAPSGTYVRPAEVAKIAQVFAGLVLIDEAYVDFAEGDCVSLVKEFENVMVTRSLSKAYSLAGLRFGYGIARPEVICELAKAKDSYPCDAISIVAATAAIEDQAYVQRTWAHVKSERVRLTQQLQNLGWSVMPSQANFLLVTVPDNRARETYLGLKRRDILVRYFEKPGLADKLRITIGTTEENDTLLAAIRQMKA